MMGGMDRECVSVLAVTAEICVNEDALAWSVRASSVECVMSFALHARAQRGLLVHPVTLCALVSQVCNVAAMELAMMDQKETALVRVTWVGPARYATQSVLAA